MPQILIDTDAMTAAEIGATVNFLDDLLTIRRAKDDKAPAPPVNETAPPPPPAKWIDDSDPVAALAEANDPEIETDDENSVKSVTVLATAAPPPPPVHVYGETSTFGQRDIPAAAPAPPGPAATPEYDAKGAPWDGRIHASNRAKKIDGTWKNKRGVSADLITACEAQNKPGNVPTAPAAIALTGVAGAITGGPGLAPPPPPPAAPLSPAAPSAVTSSAVPSTGAATAATIDFRGLMQKIQSATAANKLTAEQVNTALAGVGLKPEEMAQLINNAPLIASLNAAVDACLTS